MTDRIPLDHLTSDALDELYDRLEQAEATLTRLDQWADNLDDRARALAGPDAEHPVAAHVRHILGQPTPTEPSR